MVALSLASNTGPSAFLLFFISILVHFPHHYLCGGQIILRHDSCLATDLNLDQNGKIAS